MNSGIAVEFGSLSTTRRVPFSSNTSKRRQASEQLIALKAGHSY